MAYIPNPRHLDLAYYQVQGSVHARPNMLGLGNVPNLRWYVFSMHVRLNTLGLDNTPSPR